MVRKHRPDIVVAYTSYDLPAQSFVGVGCTKVLIETDFHVRARAGDLGWYNKNKFDLIVQRGAFDCRKDLGAPVVWLPFSADEKEFFPKSFRRRSRKIGFAGSIGKNPNNYAQRRAAVEMLQRADLIDKRARRIKQYPKFIRNSVGFLTSTGLDSPHGKAFEVWASGTVLLSPSFKGERSLLGNKECYVNYSRDCSDVVEKARRIVEDNNYAKTVAKNGYRAFLENHTHQKRIQELVEHLEAILSGDIIKPKWSLT
jgi:spore maturation protein CgeB